MDTPEKSQISSSLSKFEDSPIFKYINSLSPIKPVKSMHVTQTFNPLSFASLPSIFTSPHVSSHKESRFLKCSTDPSKPELSSADGTKVSTIQEAGVDVQENFDPGVSLGVVSFELPNEPSRIAIELPQTLKYDCGSPDCDPAPCVIETNCVSESTCTSLAIVPFVQEDSQKGLSDGVEVQESSEKGLSDGVEVAATFQIERKRETLGSDWESLISETSDLLIFNSPNDSEAFRGVIQKSLDPGTTFCPTLISQFPQDDINDYKDQTEGTGGLNEINHVNESFEDDNVTNFVSGSLTDYMENRLSAPYSFKPGSNLHRGFRRRCLDFEMVAARRKSLDSGSNTNSSIDNKLEPGKVGGDSSRCIVPGIGLHLNALAIASRDNSNMKLDTLSSGTQKLILPCSTTFNSPAADQEIAHESFLASASTERETDDVKNGVQLAEDASQASTYLANEESNQNSPKKKRRRLEQAGETDACKRCNCKKSKCLKLYCECFAAGVYCIEPPGIFWTVKKDITRYSSLLLSNKTQTFAVYLGNLVDKTYTGVYHVNVTLYFYPAVENFDLYMEKRRNLGSEIESKADMVIPFSRDLPLNDGLWYEIQNANDVKVKEFEIPQNVYRAVLEVYVSFHENDEFWYGNLPNEFIAANNLTGYAGNGPFREVVVSLDGDVIGAVWPFTVVFTGGINPLLWRPISAIGSFDLPTYDIEITPFLGNLLNGKPHNLSFSVTNALNVWYIDANLHLWLDSKSAKTEGKLLQYVNVPLSVSSVLDFKGLNGTFVTNTTRFISSTGWVKSSYGTVTTKAIQDLSYSNTMVMNGNLQIINQIIHFNDSMNANIPAPNALSKKSLKRFLFHLYSNEIDQGNGTSLSLANVTLGFDEKKFKNAYSGSPSSSLKNLQKGEGVMVVKNNLVISGVASTQQSYSYHGGKFCYSRNVSSSNYTILSDEVERTCNKRSKSSSGYGLSSWLPVPARRAFLTSYIVDPSGNQ